MATTEKYQGAKRPHGNNKTPIAADAIYVEGMDAATRLAVCRYAAQYTYGRNRVAMFGPMVKTGAVETVASINYLTTLGGLTGATQDEAEAFRAAHPDLAAKIDAYAAAQRAK